MSILNLVASKQFGFDPKALMGSVASAPVASPSKFLNQNQVGALATSFDLGRDPGQAPDTVYSSLAGSDLVGDALGNSAQEIVVTGVADRRMRLIAGITEESMKQVLGANDPTSNLLAVLYTFKGIMFPFTPTINVSQAVNWDPIALSQTNWDVNAYQKTPSVNISIAGTFTAQNPREGEYLMAVIHFLRVVTKSYFGIKDQDKAGIPPPVLYLNGYGDAMFNYLPCVVKSTSYSFDESTDTNYFVSRSGNSAMLPAKLVINMELGVQINPDKQRTEFSLDEFRTGNLLKNGGWF
jgi:hypothetical protein